MKEKKGKIEEKQLRAQPLSLNRQEATELSALTGVTTIPDDFWQARIKKTDERGRISNALSLNIVKPKQGELFESTTSLTASNNEKYVDGTGKIVPLSVEDIQLIKALSSYLPFNNPEIKEYIEAVNTMDAKGQFKNAPKSPIEKFVSFLQLSTDIIGDSKEASLKKIEARMKRLANISQEQTFFVDGEKFSVIRPLISMEENVVKYYSEIRSKRGRKKSTESNRGEDKIMIGANVRYSSLFLYKAANEYCPLYPQRLFNIWRHNKTEMFTKLLTNLESKWRQYYIASVMAEKSAREKYKELRINNRTEYNRLVSEAKAEKLFCKLSTVTIRSTINTDYESTREAQRRFIPDLQRAINSLIEYGIITDKSHIAGQNAIFAYNPDFVPKDTDKTLLLNAE